MYAPLTAAPPDLVANDSLAMPQYGLGENDSLSVAEYGLGDNEPLSPYGNEEDALEMVKIASMGKSRRGGVAAESVSETRIREYIKPVHPKDDYTKAVLRQLLKEHEKLQVLFGHLNGNALEDVVNAFQTVDVMGGDIVIRQGDDGDRLYIICDGYVDIFVARPDLNGCIAPGDRGSKVVTFGPGALFGELALMYNSPRQATVEIASPTARLWAFDREAFQMLLAGNSSHQYQVYEGWLAEVEIFKPLNHYELSRLSELLESSLHDAGEAIIVQGDIGDRFFILEDGTCSAYMTGPEGEVEVMRYETKGSYFGEVALLVEETRRATVRATGLGCIVLSLSKEDFTSVLGPISDILRLHIDRYPQYAHFLSR